MENFDKLKPIELPKISINPLVSVLMPNYNYANYIDKAIESVLNQTYANWELIICDDGSTDNSVEIIEKYFKLDKRIKLICKDNGGQASALNTAYRNSIGEVISILDSDDIFYKDKIEKVVNAFYENPDSGFCTHKVLPVDSKGSQISYIKKIININLTSGYAALEALENGGEINLPPASGLSFRKEIIEFIFPIPVGFNYYADGIISELAQYISKICVVNEPLTKFRLHANNLTSSLFDVPNEEVIRKVDEKTQLFVDTNKNFLAKNFGKEIVQKYNFRDRPGYWEGRLALYILRLKPKGGIDGYSSKELLSFIKNENRKFLWKIIIALPKRISIKVLKLWWSPSPLKKYFSFLSKYIN